MIRPPPGSSLFPSPTLFRSAHMAAAKLLSEARRRAATRLAVAEDEIKYGAGVLTAPGREVTLGALAAERRLRSEEHTSELQSRLHLVCRLLLENKKITTSDT